MTASHPPHRAFGNRLARRLLPFVLGNALLTGLTACGGSGAASGPVTVAVTIKNYKFVPALVKIHRGDTVKWTNSDPTAHTVTSDPGDHQSFGSSALNRSNTYSIKFARAGDFKYHCSYHSFMMGTIQVS